MIFGELLNLHQFAGAVVVILGIYMTYYRRKKRNKVSSDLQGWKG
jgi:drug/metabolite transporter (DMT)-like permease